MEEKFQKEEGLSLMDIIRLLLSKIKLLILVVIIGGLLGGTFAIFRTINIDYYGTEVQFYVNPERPKETSSTEGSQYGVYGAYGRHVMDNMVKLLSSESFTEHLILNGRTIPEEGEWTTKIKADKDVVITEDYIDQKNAEFTEKLNKLIRDTDKVLGKAEEAKEKAHDLKEVADTELENLKEVWTEEVNSPESAYWSYSKAAYQQLLKNNLVTDALKAAYDAYDQAQTLALEALADAEAAVAIAEAETEKTLELWRTSNEFKRELNRYSGLVSYSYLEGDADTDDANNLARSFIYVKISVLNDQDFAIELYERIISVVPIYVEANMAVPSDYEGTNCQRITRTDEIDLTNKLYTTNQAIKFAFLFAAAALVITAVVIIVVDRSDKRLRDQETIVRMFNVPVLGVVPTIEDLTEISSTKKKGAYVKPKKTKNATSSAKPEKVKKEKPVKVKKEKPVKEKKEKPVKEPKTKKQAPVKEAAPEKTEQPDPAPVAETQKPAQNKNIQNKNVQQKNGSKKSKSKKGNRR